MANKQLEVWLVSSFNQETSVFFQRIISDFEKEHKISIKLKLLPWTKLFFRLVESFKNNQAPDVFQLGSTWVRTLAHLGYLAEVPSDFERPPLTRWVKECCQYRGKRIAIPWFIEVRSMLVNNKLAQKYGIKPEKIQTHEDFFKVCQQLADRKQKEPATPVPFLLPIRPEPGTLNLYMTWLFTGGWKFPSLAPIPEKIFGDISFINSFGFIPRLIKSCNIDHEQLKKHPSTMYNQFLKGEYLFYMGNWQIASLKDARGESVFSKIPIPVSTSKWQRWGGGSVFCVSSQSPITEVGWDLVRSITGPENIKEWISVSGELPSFDTEFWWENMEDDSVSRSFDLIQDSQSYPLHPLWKRLEDMLSEKITNYLWYLLEEENTSVADSLSVLKPIDLKIRSLLNKCWEKN